MAANRRIQLLRGASQFPALQGVQDFTPATFTLPQRDRIEALVAATQAKGKLPLWEGYQALEDYGRKIEKDAARNINDVRSDARICQFYAWLVTQKRPAAILEFGAAFGASGMYWLAGLEETGQGKLYSFEPNDEWCAIAGANMAAISDRATLTHGTFEDNLGSIPAGSIDLALIDAIHTGAFVTAQFELVRKVAAPGALVVFDDIDFSDDMRRCWDGIRNDPRWPAVWELYGRAGMIELPL